MLMMMMMRETTQCHLQAHVTVVQGTEELLLRTQYLSVNHDHQKGTGVILTKHQSGSQDKRGGQDMDIQLDTLGGSSSIPASHTATGFPKSKQLFCDWGRQMEAVFSFPGNKMRVVNLRFYTDLKKWKVNLTKKISKWIL
jgi:hypothetical protein